MPFQFFTFNQQKRNTLSKLGWWYMFSKYKEDGRGIRRKIIGNEKNKLKHILYTLQFHHHHVKMGPAIFHYTLSLSFTHIICPFQTFFGLENCSSWTVFVLKESVFLYHGGPEGRKAQIEPLIKLYIEGAPATITSIHSQIAFFSCRN